MKQKLNEKSILKSLLSLVVMGLFAYIAFSCLLITFFDWAKPEKTVENLEGRVVKTTYTDIDDDDKKTEYIGNRDFDGLYYGKVAIVDHDGHGCRDTTWVNYVDGKKHGIATMQRCWGETYTYCYNMGEVIDCEKSATINPNTTAYDVLTKRYPLFLHSLNTFGFDNVYVKTFLDSIETIMGGYNFDESEFDDIYQIAIDSLTETPYDSIIQRNIYLSYIEASELLKTSEFRLAVLKSHRLEEPNTFNVVQTNFPGYLNMMNQSDVTNEQFEGFCLDLDSIMTSYGPLDGEDPIYPDSVETRLDRALYIILNYEEDSGNNSPSKSAMIKLRSKILKSIKTDFLPLFREMYIRSSSQDVAFLVTAIMYFEFTQADIIKQSVRQAYYANNDIIYIPIVTTEFSGSYSETNAQINGYVISDGGGEVTERGIVWATNYNPTIDDNKEISGSGMGSYTATLTGLESDIEYYARAYATNSATTAYGNCVKFTTGTNTNISEVNEMIDGITIYPNPSSGIINLYFQNISSKSVMLRVVDLQGKIVFEYDSDNLVQGENRFQLDLSGLPVGTYSCVLTDNVNFKVTGKVLLDR